MNRDRIVNAYYELGHLADQRQQLNKAIAAANNGVQVAEKLGDVKQVEQQMKQRKEMQNVLEKVDELIRERANRDVDRLPKLIQDLTARLEAFQEMEKEVARMEASFELALSVEELSSEQRAQYEQRLTELRAATEKQLALADALLPDKAVVLSV